MNAHALLTSNNAINTFIVDFDELSKRIVTKVEGSRRSWQETDQGHHRPQSVEVGISDTVHH